MSGVDIAGLVEELRGVLVCPSTQRDIMNRAADALLAQAAELAEARAENERLTKERDDAVWRYGVATNEAARLRDKVGEQRKAIARYMNDDVYTRAARAERSRDEALAALKASEEREKGLRDALEDCIETFELAETPAFVDPHHGVEVEALGVRIGFGALMASASASWRETLERCGYPTGGEFAVGPCHATVVSALSRARSALENCKAPLADATNNPPSDPGTEQREAGR